jgi:peroxiredoxin
MSKFDSSVVIGIGSLVLIIGLGLFFNWPKPDVDVHAISQIAPDFVNIQGYINTPPITLSSLHGQVVMLHFFRIQCPDCQQDVPFLNAMYAKYHPYGLQIVGIHSPEFDYENIQANIQNFINEHGIKYPVLLDGTKATWNLYGDAYWPKDALVSKTGYLIYTHIGAGDNYNREMAIRSALSIRNY